MESELQNSYQFSSPNFIDPNVLAKNQTTRKKEEKKKEGESCWLPWHWKQEAETIGAIHLLQSH